MDKIVDGVRVPMTPAEEAEQARVAALPRRRTKGTARRALAKLESKAPEMLALAMKRPGIAVPEVADWIDRRDALKAEIDGP